MTQAKKVKENYTGKENLEVMSLAVHYNQFLLNLIQCWIKPSNSILDFGAGKGSFLRAMSVTHPKISALEPDDCYRAELESLCLVTYHDVSQLPDQDFDAIYTLNVLEHIEDDIGVLKHLHRTLRPGGVLVIYVPAFGFLYSEMDRKVGHIRRYTMRELANKVIVAGFHLEQIRYADSLGFFASMILKLFCKNGGNLSPVAVKFYDRYIFQVSRWVDVLCSQLFGKNIYLVARKKVE